MMLEVWLSAQLVTPHDLYSFVDDWHIVFLDAGAFDLIWNSLSSFARAMDLTLDFSKSFCWASQSVDRRLLRAAPIATVYAARDLGAHQTSLAGLATARLWIALNRYLTYGLSCVGVCLPIASSFRSSFRCRGPGPSTGSQLCMLVDVISLPFVLVSCVL